MYWISTIVYIRMIQFIVIQDINKLRRRCIIPPVMFTCQVVEGSDGTGELIVVSGPGGTVVSHGADGGGVVQDNDGHCVVTEVAGRTHLTGALSHLVLVSTILTADR